MLLRLFLLFLTSLLGFQSSLFAASGADWPTLGNGPAHTGYQPVTAGAPFIAGWAVKVENDSTVDDLQQPAIVGNSVFITPNIYFKDTYLASYNVQTGVQQWRYNFVEANAISSPTVDGNAVYVQRNYSSTSQVWSFNASTGLPIWSAPYLSQWDEFYAPVVANGKVITAGGTYGGIYGFNQTGGTPLFFDKPASYPDWWDEWTPAYYNGKIYEWQGGIFAERSEVTGTINWMIDLGWDWHGWSMETAPVIDNERAFLVGSPNLIAVNLASRAKAWEIPGTFKGIPAVANGIVYAIQQNNVVAYNAATGAFVASYVATQPLYWQPIVTDNLLIVSSDDTSYPNTPKTFVFKLGTSVPLQVIPYGGRISFAGNKLYIGGTDGYLRQYVIPQVGIAATDGIATEGSADSAQITVSIPSPSTTSINVAYTLSGNVVNGVDIASLSGTVTIPSGSTSSSFTITALNNGVPNNDRTFTVTLTTGDGYDLAGGSSAVITLREPRPVVSGFPASTTAGVAQSFSVSMKDSNGNTASGFTGSIAFSSSDTQADLPSNYTFVTGDNGTRSFSAALKTAGSRSIQAQIVSTTITGSQSGIIVQPAAATTLLITGPSTVSRGIASNFSVTARDPWANTSTQYTGTVRFSSSDIAAILPADYTFQSGDQGARNFSITFPTEDRIGTTTLTATDTLSSTITNTKSGITVNPPPPVVSGNVLSITAGDAFSYSINATENPTGYNATGLPNGLTRAGNVISGVVTRAGVYAIAVSAVNPGGTGIATLQLTVQPRDPHHLTLSGFSAPTPAGTSGSVTVTAEDIFNNRATQYLGTIFFKSSDQAALLPTNFKFGSAEQGQKVFSITFFTIGTQSLTAEDAVDSTIQGSLTNIQINPVPPVITSASKALGEKGSAFLFSLAATGYPAPTFYALNLPPGLVLNGNKIEGVPTVSGVVNVLVKAANVAGEASGTLSITLLKPAGSPNTPPSIDSLPTVNPNPGIMGEPVSFSVGASDSEDSMLDVMWDFGDGAQFNGIASSHVFNAVGMYDVSVKVSDGVSSTTMPVKVAINAPSGGATPPNVFAITKAAVKLNFASSNKDSLALAGTLPTKVGFIPVGKEVVVVTGAFQQSGALDEKGRLVLANWSFKLTGTMKFGAYTTSTLKFSSATKNTSLLSSLRDFGVSDSEIAKPGQSITVPILISLNKQSYLNSTSFVYTAKKGKVGSAKLK